MTTCPKCGKPMIPAGHWERCPQCGKTTCVISMPPHPINDNPDKE